MEGPLAGVLVEKVKKGEVFRLEFGAEFTPQSASSLVTTRVILDKLEAATIRSHRSCIITNTLDACKDQDCASCMF